MKRFGWLMSVLRPGASEREALDSCADGVVVCDPSGRIAYANEAARSIAAARVGAPLDSIFDRRDGPALAASMRASGAARCRAAGGVASWVRVSSAKLRDGSSIHVVCDVSAEVAREEGMATAATAATAAMRDYLSMAAHELRSPVASARVEAEGIARAAAGIDHPAGRELLRAARAIAARIDRVGAVVTNLIDAAVIRSGGVGLERERVDLSEVARAAADRASAGLPESHAGIEVDAPRPVVGSWDAFRVEHAVSNLLDNAVRHGGGSRVVVRVGASPDGRSASLSVRDGGPGISRENASKVFQKFGRVSSGGAARGLGLGLWIARSFAEQHGGTVSLRSDTGGGAEFELLLPL